MKAVMEVNGGGRWCSGRLSWERRDVRRSHRFGLTEATVVGLDPFWGKFWYDVG